MKRACISVCHVHFVCRILSRVNNKNDVDKTAVSLSRGDIPSYYIDSTHIMQSSQLLVVKMSKLLKFVMRFIDIHSLTTLRVGLFA